ncbi:MULTISPECIES: hypothetical protein [Empedobacter]|uniref:hypothetical protein n=1 Tax=Empedobacter TaxID=59734 RepID=UPI002447DD78|nr:MULTISPECIES: hypothetical protein [Empedobacter]MDH1883825.1 hypothetical protein [Empedobacter sp. GD03797]MDH2205803.1 hypothetical protein [Empedobacter sp. GD03644]MDM1041225.1 hypothetical protein [Empedobacter brevis]MDM1134711.1 hypothetical protein [Empedobacter sp. R750]
MKKMFFIAAFVAGIALQAQVSTTRINDVKLGMKLSELEKLTGQKFKLKLNEYGYPEDDLTIVSKGVTYKVGLTSNGDGNGSNNLTVYSVKSTDSSLKTLSGIKVGSSLDELLSKYKNLNISIYDGYDDKTDKRTKAFRYFNVEDQDAGSILQFKLVNDKVASFDVMYNEGC